MNEMIIKSSALIICTNWINSVLKVGLFRPIFAQN